MVVVCRPRCFPFISIVFNFNCVIKRNTRFFVERPAPLYLNDIFSNLCLMDVMYKGLFSEIWDLYIILHTLLRAKMF